MTPQQFLKEISDEQGPIKSLAEDVLQRMDHNEFIELMDTIGNQHDFLVRVLGGTATHVNFEMFKRNFGPREPRTPKELKNGATGDYDQGLANVFMQPEVIGWPDQVLYDETMELEHLLGRGNEYHPTNKDHH
jgi:hypothetical protein